MTNTDVISDVISAGLRDLAPYWLGGSRAVLLPLSESGLLLGERADNRHKHLLALIGHPDHANPEDEEAEADERR